MMLRSSLFFVFLLVTDAFVLPLWRQEPPPLPGPIPVDAILMKLMMFSMPLASMLLAFKCVAMMSSMDKMKTWAMKSIADDILTQTPHFINGLLDTSVNRHMALVDRMTHNSCSNRLLCELTVKHRIGGQDRQFSRRMNVGKQKGYDENINMAINLNANESAGSESFCERRYRGCPYGVEDISLGLPRLQNAWTRRWTPQPELSIIDLPFIMVEDYLMM